MTKRIVVDGGLSWDFTIAGLLIYGPDGAMVAKIATQRLQHVPEGGFENRDAQEDLAERLGEVLGLVTFAPPVKTEEQHRIARIDAINEFAQHEGWGIFNESEIQRIDSQDIEGADVLNDDDEAIERVRRRADAGSQLHLMALHICHDAQTDSPSSGATPGAPGERSAMKK